MPDPVVKFDVSARFIPLNDPLPPILEMSSWSLMVIDSIYEIIYGHYREGQS
jgi:hypothetical protein